MPETKIFLDTNVIIYAYDVSAKEKHEQARKLLVDLWDSGRGVLSTQVLQEFFVSVTRKIPQPLTLNICILCTGRICNQRFHDVDLLSRNYAAVASFFGIADRSRVGSSEPKKASW